MRQGRTKNPFENDLGRGVLVNRYVHAISPP